MELNKDKTVILVAIEPELPQAMAPGWTIRYTGVGKINATIGAMSAIAERKPETIINFGTAGALKPGLSGIVPVSCFYQRDMDVTALGFELGVTPFDNEAFDIRPDGVIDIDLNYQGHSIGTYTIGTGDTFVTSTPKIETDLVDMESYAIAKTCLLKKVNFQCFKYVSDEADEDAAEDWQASMRKGASLFVKDVLGIV